ncbi:hypothetical protein AVEN_91012-1, partial [Araneus ventricosus]
MDYSELLTHHGNVLKLKPSSIMPLWEVAACEGRYSVNCVVTTICRGSNALLLLWFGILTRGCHI